MLRWLIRLAGSFALVSGMLALPSVLSTTTTASADTVIDGCTIVSNPTPTDFTDCPNMNFSGLNFSGFNLSYANLAGDTFAQCPSGSCAAVDLSGANLTQADLSGATFGALFVATPTTSASIGADVENAILSGANLAGANLAFANFFGATLDAANLSNTDLARTSLTNANLSDANLTGAVLVTQFVFPNGGPTVYLFAFLTGATVTGAIFTDTVEVPSNLTVTATSPAGTVATWAMPSPGVSGVTPGACTPASGSTFPLGQTAVTCQVVDDQGDVATGTFIVTVNPPSDTTSVLVPSNGAVLAGAPYLDAAASSPVGVTNVVFELSGNGLTDQVIGTATPTLFGWVAKWNTTSVANGTYSLQSVATDTEGFQTTSAPITVTVNNQPPSTAVLIPSGGASLSGTRALLDASASSAVGIASVTFEVSGNGLPNQVVATGTPSLYGYLAQWNTTAVPNGTYTLQSVATDTVAETTTSAPVAVTVDNAPPASAVLIPSAGATQSGTAALLDASASPNVTSVTYELTGGTLTNQVIATATPTLYGWLAEWDTTSVPNGTYQLNTVASYGGGVSGTSTPITITVSN
jgi:Bacterial Ig domain/Pentapeptide repeats (8 copies)/HYR domain